MNKTKDDSLPTGIYRLPGGGYRATVNCAAGRKDKRFDAGTPVAEMKRWRNETKVKLETKHPQRKAGVMGLGTFSADVKRHLKTMTIVSWKSRRSELRAWEARVGPMQRARVTSDHVKAAVKAWSDDKVAAKTIQNRIRALTAMYHDLDGKQAWTPAEDVKLPRIERKVSQYAPVATILAVAATLERQEREEGLDPRWRARYMVLAATGQRPAFLRRAQPSDVDLERREWRIDAAKGGNPIVLPLNGDMVAAWRRFFEAHAWSQPKGTPTEKTVLKSPRTTARRTGETDLSDQFEATAYAQVLRAAGWPAHLRPYALKHSLSADMTEHGVDLETIADWHGHTGNFKTTRIYTGFAQKKLRMASDAIDGRLGWGGLAPTTTQFREPAETADARIARLRAELEAALRLATPDVNVAG